MADIEASRADPAFRADVLAGLAAPIPAVPARWFYDRRGSELFEEITRLPEYYPTRAEIALLETHCREVADITGSGDVVVEFGSGSSTKTPILLDAVQPSAYVPIDISGDFLRLSAAALQQRFPELPVFPVEGDFTRPLDLPPDLASASKLGFFPGSTIGNFVPRSACDLLRAMRETLGTGAYLLIGMDRIKDVDTLVAAYDDAQGVTAAFNMNLLHRINSELGGDIDLSAWRHRAIWNDAKARIEMHLETVSDTGFTIDGEHFAFGAGETIHTENSHKYGDRDARMLLLAAGWGVVRQWADEKFSILLAQAEPPRSAP